MPATKYTEVTMKRLLVLLLGLIILSSCASKHQAKIPITPEMKFESIIFTEQIQDKDLFDNKIYPKTTFKSDDNKVYALVTIKNFSGNHNLSWKWYDPQNRLYVETGSENASTLENYYMEKLFSYNSIDINGYKAEENKGKWRVDFYMDNKFEISGNFWIK